jgi:serine/threonine-protein kinase HipA
VKRTVEVFLGDDARRLGTIHYNADGAREGAAFSYDAAWLAQPDGFTIDPALQLVTGPQFRAKSHDGSIFPRVIADAEPDGWGRRVMLRDHAKRRQHTKRSGEKVDVRPLNHLDFLLGVDDVSRVGALRFRDEGGVFQRASEPGRRTVPPLVELARLAGASRAVETSSETEADLAYLRGRGTSLGGLRPKCTVVDDEGRLCLGKFPSVGDERAVTKGEVLAMRLARAAGIRAAEARLVDSDGVPVALITRFDRAAAGRILYASAATMLGAEPTEPLEHSYTEMVDALRRHGAAVKEDMEELWRRIAFSVLITNVDDHLMNHGFVHAGAGHWRLAPAFDINPFPERVRELKTWISPDSGPAASIEPLMAAAPYFSLKPTRAKQIVADVEHAVARWRREGRALGMSPAELDTFADAFEHEERAVARRASRVAK